MAHKKGVGSSKNGRESTAQRLGVKKFGGEKVLVFHKKRRKGYRKLNGHRQQFTELTIKEVIA